MKKTVLLLGLLILVSACRKVSKIPDYVFEIGLYDSHDRYVNYGDEPLPMSVGQENGFRSWDLDENGTADLELISFKSSQGDRVFTGLRVVCPEGSGWEVAKRPVWDSTFHCVDTNTIWGNTYYSRGKAYYCGLDLDTFVRIDTLCEIVRPALYGNDWDDMEDWGSEAYLHWQEHTIDSATTYDYELSHYYNWGVTEFFIPLRQTRTIDQQKAWFHLTVNIEAKRPVAFRIHEYAVQMFGAK